jgi:hypothetical protein
MCKWPRARVVVYVLIMWDLSVHKSSNAYMLVYERSSTKSSGSSVENPVPAGSSMTSAPIGRLAEKINRLNREYDALCDDYEHRYVTVSDVLNLG